MEKEQTIYSVDIKVRDEHGKIRKCLTRGIPEPRIQFEMVFAKDEAYSKGIEGAIEVRMKNIAYAMRSWIPEGYSIDLSASIYMNVSGDGYYMTMYSYYEGEDRFVKHS